MPRKNVTEKTESCTGATEQDVVAVEEESAEGKETATESDVSPTDGGTAEAEDQTSEPEDQTSKPEEEKRLTAILPILFESRQYAPGDVLPTHNAEMVELWIEGKAAGWMTQSSESVQARPITAYSGRSGLATPASGKEDLTGRLPWSPQRENA